MKNQNAWIIVTVVTMTLSLAVSAQTTVSVSASPAGAAHPTGVIVVAGDFVRITSPNVPTWMFGQGPGWSMGTPNGPNPAATNPLSVLPTIQKYSLIGSIGQPPAPWGIGTGWLIDDGSDVHPVTGNTGAQDGAVGAYGPGFIGSFIEFVAAVGGEIYLGANDQTLSNDNSGSATVTIEILSSLSQFYPGSGEDFVLSTGVNGPVTTTLLPQSANSGDSLVVHFESPGGSYDFTPPVLYAQLFPTGTPPFQPVDYPEVFLDFAPNVYYPTLLLYSGQSSAFSQGLLPPGGMTFSYGIPNGLSGLSLMIQAYAVAPSGNTGNTWFTATDGREIMFP